MPLISDQDGVVDGTPKIDAERAQLDDRILALEKELLLLKNKRNELSPISRLPPEVLARAFIFFAQTVPLRLHSRYSVKGGWGTVSGICSHWRNVALSCPQLWSEVNSQFPLLVPMMLQRSKQIPIALTISGHASDPEHLSTSIHRVRLLDVTARWDEGRQEISDGLMGLRSPAPHLQSLALRVSSNRNYWRTNHDDIELHNDFLGGHAPNLQKVELQGWRIPWTSPLLSNSLTSLRVSSRADEVRFEATHFVGAFERMTSLRTLELSIANLTFIGESGIGRVAGLPCLERFKFGGKFTKCAEVLNKLQFPASALVTLDCENDTVAQRHSIAAGLAALTACWLSAPLAPDSNPCLLAMKLHHGRLECWLHTLPEAASEWNRLSHTANNTIPALTITFWSSRRILTSILSELPLDQLRQIAFFGEELCLRAEHLDRLGSLPRLEYIQAVPLQSSTNLVQFLLTDPAFGNQETPNSLERVTYFKALKTICMAWLPYHYDPNGPPDNEELLDLLMWRYEFGGEIETLVLTASYDDHIAKLGEVVANLRLSILVKPTRESYYDS